MSIKKLAVVPHSIVHHHKQCTCVCQGALPSSRLRYTWAKPWVHKFTRTITGRVLVICTAHVEGRQPGGAKSTSACNILLCVVGENNIGIFKFQPQPPNHQIHFPIKFSGYDAIYCNTVVYHCPSFSGTYSCPGSVERSPLWAWCLLTLSSSARRRGQSVSGVTQNKSCGAYMA